MDIENGQLDMGRREARQRGIGNVEFLFRPSCI